MGKIPAKRLQPSAGRESGAHGVWGGMRHRKAGVRHPLPWCAGDPRGTGEERRWLAAGRLHGMDKLLLLVLLLQLVLLLLLVLVLLLLLMLLLL